ncbi:corticoliberin [Sphaerodactylus townsendi]|uniref:corticoliberin n=1 Tax=Sphaerodactylus townsendi TaxID=933632 RepID=UPI002025CAB9|nr:corticoliberin [Sphaerodactylus townsendi]
MKIQLLVSTGILLVALSPCHECRALSKGAPAADPAPQQQPDLLQARPPSLPVLLRMGEEYFLRLGNLRKTPAAAAASSSSSPLGSASLGSGGSSSSSRHLAASASAGNFFRAAVQQLQHLSPLPERSLEGPAEPWEGEGGEADGAHLEEPPRGKRSEEPPISLDLTFHLLREVLEMARAEQLAQQAHSNRKLMEIIGK